MLVYRVMTELATVSATRSERLMKTLTKFTPYSDLVALCGDEDEGIADQDHR